MRNSRGPRIDPCGTPLDTFSGRENAFPRLTKKVLFMRKDRNQFTLKVLKVLQIGFCGIIF